MDLKNLGAGMVVGVGVAICLPVALFAYFGLYDTPDFNQLRDSIEVPIKLANGDPSTKRMGPKAPGWVPRSQISDYLAKAVVASEDTAFYSHSGIDVHEIQEAIKKDLKEGKFSRGASTLTQQVLKNVYLGNSKSLWRKFRELVLAPRLEKSLSKSEILTFYLNMAEWGPGIYGCGEAARHYFGVSPSQLSAKQSVFLAMLLPSPRRYHAYFRTQQLTQWANKRIERILDIMHRMNQISDDDWQVALNEHLWGKDPLADDAPNAPKDPGFVTEGDDDFKESNLLLPSVAVRPKTTPPNATKVDETKPYAEGATVPPEEPLSESDAGASPVEPVSPD